MLIVITVSSKIDFRIVAAVSQFFNAYSGFLLGGFRRYQPVATVVQVASHLCRLLVYSCLLGIMKNASFEKFIKNYIEFWNSFKPELFVDSRVANKLSYNSCTV